MPPFPPQATETGGMPPSTAPLDSVSSMPEAPVPMSEEHKAILKELLSKVKQEYSKWKSMSFGVQNKANEERRDQLKTVFQILQAKGVNLNDQKSVAAFLEQLKKTAPQHFDAITKALDYLLGTDYETQQQTPENPEGEETLAPEGGEEVPLESILPPQPAQ